MSKNRSTKRLFAVALSLMMVLALLPVTALAAETLTGTLSITGDAKFDQTLTAAVDTPNAPADTLIYTWMRGGVDGEELATGNEYTIVAGDIGETITVVVTSSNEEYTGELTETTSTVVKADGPATPTSVTGSYKIEEDDKVTYTVDPIDGAEYSSNGTDYGSNRVFGGYETTGTPTFYARIAETDTHLASLSANTGEVAFVFAESVTIGVKDDADPKIDEDDGTLQLTAVVGPAGAQQKVVWSIVEGQGLAKIDETGLLTAIANGIVKVQATAADGTDISSEETLEITITNQRTSYTPPQVIVPETPEIPDVIEGTPDDDMTEEEDDGTLVEEDDLEEDIVDDIPETGDGAVSAVWAVLAATLVFGAAAAFVMKKKAADNR